MPNLSYHDKVFRFSKDHLVWGDFVVFLLLVIAAIVRLQGPPQEPFDRTIEILRPIDSVRVSTSVAGTHNSTLIGIIEGRYIGAGTLDASRADTRMQARIFYAAILAGLVLLLFRDDHKMKRRVGLFLLVLTSVMYALDVHLEDLNKRQLDAASIFGRATEGLINQTPGDSTWFALTFRRMEEEMGKASETGLWRKSRAATRPNVEQIIYYFIPWFVVYGFTRPSLAKKNRRLTIGAS
jgi:hypothetical protein